MRQPPPDSVSPQNDALPPKLWTADEVRALRRNSPPLSLWRVVRWQLIVAVALGGLAWGANQLGWAIHQPSVWWGALCALLPSTVAAWGLRRAPGNAGLALMRLGVWELAKVLLSVALLVSAHWAVAPVQWLALVSVFVVVTKVFVVVGVLHMRGRQTGATRATSHPV